MRLTIQPTCPVCDGALAHLGDAEGSPYLQRTFLDELDPTAGNYSAEDITCSLDCTPIEAMLAPVEDTP